MLYTTTNLNDWHEAHVGAYMYDANTVEFCIAAPNGKRLMDGFATQRAAQDYLDAELADMAEDARDFDITHGH